MPLYKRRLDNIRRLFISQKGILSMISRIRERWERSIYGRKISIKGRVFNDSDAKRA